VNLSDDPASDSKPAADDASSIGVTRSDLVPARELVGEDLALVVRICRRYRHTPLSFAELVSAGNEGLVHANRRYDPGYGVPFHAYARRWIQRCIGAAIHQARYPVVVPRDYRSTIRHVARSRDTLHGALGRTPTLGELVEHTGLARDVIEDVLRLEQPAVEIDAPARRQDRHAATEVDRDALALVDRVHASDAAIDSRVDIERLLPAALERLTERERTIISLHYGLASGGAGLSDAKIANMLHYSEERIRQLRRAAEARLRSDGILHDDWDRA
jgi:RNA polymerase sigma factor (sigma-70 family)